ncbi:MAG TPA: DUF3391 domain-containing protein [Thiobacillaceae bacterium]|nr:DUF3391 domain-containing protein [Thiobacillaceae bacterium]HNA82967.1 DUF3391 domain-containing protein [Thiobacillaceae bacterium]HNF89206.1 DUF3391 domain-containing protein [Thiobacillaceae bacterium]HNH88183.1 DUF3391 domain-containing protein [Thiobacillaceae bacterium]HNI08495.1 DUF3391 domain-containing protein [Thiobacillaceae bacterium]
MWVKPGQRVPLDPTQLVVGLYIEMEATWTEHPFLSNRFKLANAKQIAEVRALKMHGRLFYYPNKSDAEPPEKPAVEVQAPPQAEASETLAIAAEIERQKKEKAERLQALKDAANRADRAWEAAARVTKEALVGMDRSPKTAGVQLKSLSEQTAREIFKGKEVLLHLLGDKNGEGPQYHALNCMTLGMLVGKEAKLSESQLSDLALGLMAHDVGKARVPAHLLKSSSRAKHEEAFYRDHPKYGVELATIAGVFSPLAMTVISDHHECLDGSGWPAGKSALGPAARIGAIVDRYDRLCSPEAQGAPALTPSEALAQLFKTESSKYDAYLFKILIRLLGVYPPGSIVKLSDESLALVVSPGRESLRPVVLIYNPDLKKEDAPTMDLGENDEIKIVESIRPSNLPDDVVAWLNPRQRLSYFYSSEGSS